MRTLTGLLLVAFLLAPAPVAAAPLAISTANDYDHSVATAWFELMTELIRQSPGFTPPVASRAMGYAGVTLYEAVVPGMPGYQSLVGQINGLTWMPRANPEAEYHWPLVANSALASINRRLFAHGGAAVSTSIDGLEETIRRRYEGNAPRDVLLRSISRGRMVAAAVFEWSKHDGGHEGYLYNFPATFQPPTGPGLWEPTPPKYQSALQPYWGENRPFVLQSGADCRPAPPPGHSTDLASDAYWEAMEVFTTVKNLTPAQRDIALYWADDPTLTATPPGHSLAIATQVLRQDGATLAMAAETYARLGMGLADSFIACWNAKFYYNRMRPITYIQRYIDPAWNTPEITDPVNTPPFPEYPSGHSTEAGAAATIMTSLFGDAYTFTDGSQTRLGFAPRTFPSFWAAAEEAAVSRLYGGIHYRSANEQGLEQGRCIGEAVMQIQFKAGE
ncbi:MAG: vanadium-dependent haloperoxidase [Caldilineaceae bacterium]|nr:vanadium-dependent haloperoxidase [Caldilineaceae bacterium]